MNSEDGLEDRNYITDRQTNDTARDSDTKT